MDRTFVTGVRCRRAWDLARRRSTVCHLLFIHPLTRHGAPAMSHQCIACSWGRARENQTLPPPSKPMNQSEWSGSAHNSSPKRKESLQGTGTAYMQAKGRKGEPGQGEWPVPGLGPKDGAGLASSCVHSHHPPPSGSLFSRPATLRCILDSMPFPRPPTVGSYPLSSLSGKRKQGARNAGGP